MVEGLVDGRIGLVGYKDRGLSIAADVLDKSTLMSELFSLLLLQEPSVSLFRLIGSDISLVFSTIISSLSFLF